MTQLSATELPIGKIFCDDFLFKVPDYQRPYSWGADQVTSLVEDLAEAAQRDQGSAYFLGSVVLIKSPDEPHAEIVDGQQRLTTLTIMLCVIRDLFEHGDEAREIQELIGQKQKKFSRTEGTFRLTLRDRDEAFFRKSVQEPDATRRAPPPTNEEAQKRILESVGTLRKRLEAYDPRDLERLVSFVVQQCMLVVVSAFNEETAFRIFEVMNNRGLPLAPSDIIKAEVIGAAKRGGDKAAAECRQIWEDVENELGRAALQDLLANICIVRKRGKLEGAITSSMRHYLKPAADPVDFVDDVFKPYADAFMEVREPVEGEGGVTARSAGAIAAMNRLGNGDWQAVALEILMRFRDDPERIEALLADLERVAFLMSLTSVYYNRRMSRYGAILTHLSSNPEPDDPGPLDLTDDERQAMRAQIEGNVYLLANATRRALLLRLDELMADAPGTYRYRTLTIEHVLPQMPPPQSAWRTAFPDELHARWVHRLANLVLLAQHKNARAGTMDFARKKEAYFARSAPNFALTTQVMGAEEWTPETLERRQRRLVGVLANHWRL